MELQSQDKILDPSFINFDGDFYTQMDAILKKIRLNREDVLELKKLYDDLEECLRINWPGVKIYPYGSIVTGLGIKTSDADCYADIPERFRHPEEKFVNKAKNLFLMYPDTFRNVFAIPQAKVPIVKFHHIPTRTNCDVSFKNQAAAYNSELIGFLMFCHPRILPLALLIKYWAKVHNLTGMNLLSNYSLILLVVFYLQHVKMLPSVQWLQRRCELNIVDNWNTNYMNEPSEINLSTDIKPIHMLLGEFFKFYNEFDFENDVVSTFAGYAVKKEAFRYLNTLSDIFDLYKHNVREGLCTQINLDSNICVQDVFDHSRNCTVGVPNKVTNYLKEYIHLATNIYEDNKSRNNYDTFLRDLLTVKIKPPKPKPFHFAHRDNKRKNITHRDNDRLRINVTAVRGMARGRGRGRLP